MRQRDEFHTYFDAQSVDEIWDCTAILQVLYYDSKNLSYYVYACIGHKVTSSNCSPKGDLRVKKISFLNSCTEIRGAVRPDSKQNTEVEIFLKCMP